MSVPAAAAVLAVELSRSFSADAANGVNAPGMPAAPVGVSAPRMFAIMVLSRPPAI